MSSVVGMDEYAEIIRGEQGVLLCPVCGGFYLHHESITEWYRHGGVVAGEDGDSAAVVLIEAGKAEFWAVANHNPSSRRGAVRITFWCECCDKRSSLIFEQHKGRTFCGWSGERSSAEGPDV